MLTHPRHDRAAGEEHRRDVHVHDLPPLVERDLGERPHRERRVEAGVVDEDVDAAAALHRLVDHPADGRLVGNVDLEPDAVRERLRRLARVLEVGDDHARARVGEASRDRVADALRAAGDDCDLPVESAAHRSGENEVGTRIRFCCVWISGWIFARKRCQRSSACSCLRRSSRSPKLS